MSRALTPEEERLLQGFLEAFHYPEPVARRLVLGLRDDALQDRRAELLAALESMDPKMAARAIRVLADQIDDLADNIEHTLEDPNDEPDRR